MRWFLPLLIASAIAVAGCATSDSPDGRRPSGADARGGGGPVRRAPDSPASTAAPATSGKRYALRIDAARAAIRDGEGRAWAAFGLTGAPR